MEHIDMEITKEALRNRKFHQEPIGEDGDYFTMKSGTWGHYIKVSFFFPEGQTSASTLVELCSYNEPFIFARGVKTVEDIDQIIRLFI